MSRVIEHFPEWMTGGGLFAGLTGMPWDDDVSDKKILDIEYFGNRSGLKNSSVLLEHMTVYHGDTVLTDVEMARLRGIVTTKFLDSWTRIYNAMKKEYEALEDFFMVEERTPNLSVKGKVSPDFEQKSTSEKSNSNTESSSYGFGGSGAKPTTKVTDSYKITNTTEQTGYSEQETTGSDKWEKHGSNRGPQEMLQAEIDIRRRHFFEIVFEDVDSILTRGSWT